MHREVQEAGVNCSNGGVVVPGKKYTSDCSQYGIGFKLDTDGWVDGWVNAAKG